MSNNITLNIVPEEKVDNRLFVFRVLLPYDQILPVDYNDLVVFGFSWFEVLSTSIGHFRGE